MGIVLLNFRHEKFLEIFCCNFEDVIDPCIGFEVNVAAVQDCTLFRFFLGEGFELFFLSPEFHRFSDVEFKGGGEHLAMQLVDQLFSGHGVVLGEERAGGAVAAVPRRPVSLGDVGMISLVVMDVKEFLKFEGI